MIQTLRDLRRVTPRSRGEGGGSLNSLDMISGKHSQHPPREPWFSARKELSPKRSAILTLFSSALPLLVWCAVSYLPFLWHPDVELQISADREGVTTVYTPGDRVSEEFFPEFEAAVRTQNEE
ncbi:MAG: hypothetical protein ABL994_08670, partial [Verrucomicrobiales bacterium]